jgi:hypothetical protein
VKIDFFFKFPFNFFFGGKPIFLSLSLFCATQTMPRKKGDAGNDSGNASIRAFFTATPVRERTDSASANSSTAPPERTAPATGNPKSSQIHSTGGNAGSARGAGGSARAVQRQLLRAESDEGEEVDYSGTCFCSVHVCSTF